MPFIDQLMHKLADKVSLVMPRELTDEEADAALRATAVHLDIKGSQLTKNREKMKARYRALVKHIEGKDGIREAHHTPNAQDSS